MPTVPFFHSVGINRLGIEPGRLPMDGMFCWKTVADRFFCGESTVQQWDLKEICSSVPIKIQEEPRDVNPLLEMIPIYPDTCGNPPLEGREKCQRRISDKSCENPSIGLPAAASCGFEQTRTAAEDTMGHPQCRAFQRANGKAAENQESGAPIVGQKKAPRAGMGQDLVIVGGPYLRYGNCCKDCPDHPNKSGHRVGFPVFQPAPQYCTAGDQNTPRKAPPKSDRSDHGFHSCSNATAQHLVIYCSTAAYGIGHVHAQNGLLRIEQRQEKKRGSGQHQPGIVGNHLTVR